MGYLYSLLKESKLTVHTFFQTKSHKELANAVIGESSILIKDEDVFKTFHNIDRV